MHRWRGRWLQTLAHGKTTTQQTFTDDSRCQDDAECLKKKKKERKKEEKKEKLA